MQSVAELNREYAVKARALGLKVDCLGDGAFNAQIAIIGEAPGEREVTLKVPLVGGSGQVVWKTLGKHNISRRDVYITNVCKRQLSFVETQDKIKLPKAELDHWEALLKWELAQLPNCKFVLVLGNMPLKALAGVDGITRWRGSVVEFEVFSFASSQPRQYRALATFNPAHVIREPKNEISFIMDCAKLPMVASGRYKKYEIHGTILYDHASIVKALEGINDGNAHAFDIETSGGETACIGFAQDSHNGFTIPFRSIKGDSYLSLEEEVDVRRRLQSLFNQTLAPGGPRWIAQNANFDMCWLWYKDKIHVPRCWSDTMLAHHCLYPTLPHTLGYLTTQYTTHPYYKDERTEWRDKGDIEGFWQYNIKDCCITQEVNRRLIIELKEQGLERFYFDHIMRLQPHLTRMTVGGVLIDVESKDRIAEELKERVSILCSDFHNRVGEVTGNRDYAPNPLSRPAISELLFQRLKLVGRGTSTDEANRKRMFEHPRTSDGAKDILRILNTFRKEHKFLSTYAESGVDDDRRMRCEWKQTGVKKAPGRLSSAQVMWGSGMNLQNQPPRARSMFISDPDFVFCYFDLVQAEAQFVAYDAGIRSWKEQYARSRLDGSYDSHRALAAEIFKVPYDQVPVRDEIDGTYTIRYRAKRARHGLNYRMAPDTFSEAAGIPFTEAVELYTVYHRLHPELRNWWAKLEHEVRSTKQLFNAYGRRLYFLERLNNEEALESIVAFRPQSSIGDKVSRVIYMSHDDDEWPKPYARIAINAHDALIAICHKDHTRKCLKVMKKHAEEPMLIKGEQLIIPAEMGMSEPDEHGVHRWSTIKKVKLIGTNQ